MGEITTCGTNISTFLQPHYNWDEPILPTIPGCLEVQFTTDYFTVLSEDWLCLQETELGMLLDSSA